MSNQVLTGVEDINHAIDSVSNTIETSAGNSQEIARGTENTNRSIAETVGSAIIIASVAEELNSVVNRLRLQVQSCQAM